MANISLEHITKIEGHGHLHLTVENGQLTDCKFGTTEGSRYFEGLLKGRRFTDAAEITSRICGICSSAHGIASVLATERAFGVEETPQTYTLRELQTVGERIRSHAAHTYLLALPDYLGYESALDMAGKFPNEVKRALRLVKLGNDMVTLASGRVMHQVATDVGGFNHFPKQSQLDEIRKRLVAAKDDIMETAKLWGTIKPPELNMSDLPYYCLSEDHQFATSHGHMRLNDKKFPQKDYKDFLKEERVPQSNANHIVHEGKGVYVGTLARFNINFKHLSDNTKAMIDEMGLKFPNHNPFINNHCQALEMIHYMDYFTDVLETFEVRFEPKQEFTPKAGEGVGYNEAPRGVVVHEYHYDDKGYVTWGNVITPTAHYLRHMQTSIGRFVQQMLDQGKGEKDIVEDVEKLIRSYDPCMSCATHWLKVHWHRK